MVPDDGDVDEEVGVEVVAAAAADSEAFNNTDFTTSPTRLALPASPLFSTASPSLSVFVVDRFTQKGSRTPLLLDAAVVDAVGGDRKDFPFR